MSADYPSRPPGDGDPPDRHDPGVEQPPAVEQPSAYLIGSFALTHSGAVPTSDDQYVSRGFLVQSQALFVC